MDDNVRGAAADALGKIATGERAGPVINKLLPLLGGLARIEETRAEADARLLGLDQQQAAVDERRVAILVASRKSEVQRSDFG
jgi:hypothetical protein